MLSEGEKTDTRRYLGYPVHGSNGSGNMAWQYYQVFGSLEWRLDNLTNAEEAVLRRYLGSLAALELAIPATALGLETGSAAGWVRNPAELAERAGLFDDWRRRLVGFLGVPPGPALQQSRNDITLVI